MAPGHAVVATRPRVVTTGADATRAGRGARRPRSIVPHVDERPGYCDKPSERGAASSATLSLKRVRAAPGYGTSRGGSRVRVAYRLRARRELLSISAGSNGNRTAMCCSLRPYVRLPTRPRSGAGSKSRDLYGFYDTTYNAPR